MNSRYDKKIRGKPHFIIIFIITKVVKHRNKVADYSGQETWCGSRRRLNSEVIK
ncbi:unnamed protein product [Brassica rapa]|uniref:Uncharacterized protein n=1 Tax=Brassica campestris TaxID=3711 RepID=A0A8D9HBI7_BRACM|nr:unnamed protein product [Brassica rapa]